MNELIGRMVEVLHTEGYAILLAAMAAVALVLVIALRRAIRRGRADRWVSNVAGFAVLALSAEGMWVVAREKLHLPALLAGAVFFVAEAAMLSSAMQANRHQAQHMKLRAQADEAEPGEKRDRLVAEARRWNPGKHARAVWTIAIGAGAIVSLNSHSVVEAPLRLALPVLAAYLWWNSLTDGGVTRERERSSWRWTPRRALLWVGALEPGDRDASAIDRARRVAAMTRLARRVHRGGRRVGRATARLEELALKAGADEVREVQVRVAQAWEIVERTAPGASRPEAAKPAVPSVPSWAPVAPATPVVVPAVAELPRAAAMATPYRAPSAAVVSGTVSSNGASGIASGNGASGTRASGTRASGTVSGIGQSGIGQSGIGQSGSRASGTASGTRASGTASGTRAPRTASGASASATGTQDRAELREQARAAYRQSVADGTPLSGAELARRYGVSDPKWGTRQIVAVRAEAEAAGEEQQ